MPDRSIPAPEATEFSRPAPPPPPPPPPSLVSVDAPAEAIAPAWHTVLVLALLLATMTFTSTRAASGHTALQHASQAARLISYSISIAAEWVLFGVVLLGVRRRREFLQRSFRGARLSWPSSLGAGFAVYCCGFIAIAIVAVALYPTPLFHKRNPDVLLAIAPHTPLEMLFWFGVSITAGITEELIFRGYLQTQFTAWTRRSAVAVVIASAIFGSVHLYEGLGAVLPLVALALVYGFVARALKGDLRTVIVAHTLQDFIVALLLLARPVLERLSQQQPH